MLLTKMPVRSNPPEPKRVIAFEQALRIRMKELGLNEAGLTNRYADLLNVKADRRRNVILRIIRGETDPRLKTVLNLLDARVLDGELLIRWIDDGVIHAIRKPEELAESIQRRMEAIGLNPNQPSAFYELARRYCQVKFEGKPHNPANFVKVMKQLTSEPNSQIQTITLVVQAMRGELLIRWKKTVRKRLGTPDAALGFLDDLPLEQALVIEYQVLSEEQEIQR